MLQLKCPNCGADITLDDTREFGFCSYCGTKVLLDEYKKRVDGVPGVANLLLRAEDCIKKGKLYEADQYYNRVLDIDINNMDAINGLQKIKDIKKSSEIERQKRLNNLEYGYAMDVVEHMTDIYNNIGRKISGIDKCLVRNRIRTTSYTFKECTRDEAIRLQTSNTDYGNFSEEDSVDLDKISSILHQEFLKRGYKHEILLLSIPITRMVKSKFLGFEYNSKNTIMTYDFWISIG
jgi:DNA-directed RNA polymerase subunit RPC12/RpoP